MSLGSWGPIVFEVSADKVRTFTDVKRRGKARWATHDVHLGKPVKEFLGSTLDNLSMVVRFDLDRGVVPRDELRALRKARDAGAVNTLTIGDQPVFECTLEEITEDLRRFDAHGVLTTAVAELFFEEYA